MPFPIRPQNTVADIRALVAHYWTNLDNAIAANNFITATNKGQLVEDYCKIGAFLSDNNLVEAALVPLEEQIRANILQLAGTARAVAMPTGHAGAVAVTTRRQAGGGAHMKAHKVLSEALRRSEAEGGFNHEKLVNNTMMGEIVAADVKRGTLHAGGSTLDMASPGRALKPTARSIIKNADGTTANPQPEGYGTMALPSGVPTVHAQLGGLDGRTFNSVLLRHGYQFKDVGAGPYHGEYSHRLQWFAIMRRNLGLTNTPLEIFRSLGYMTAKADRNVPPGRHLYLWEMLFDCGTSDQNAIDVSGTLAYCNQTYNSPEILNTRLMARINKSYANLPDLWCLRVLLATRYKKRADNAVATEAAPLGKIATKIAAGGPRAVKAVVSGDMVRSRLAPDGSRVDETLTVPNLDQASYALAWYLRE